MIKVMLGLAMLLAVFGYAADQLTDKKEIAEGATPQAGMKQYWLVLLKKGPNRDQDSAAAAKIQDAHMRNIQAIAKSGALVMAGPVGNDADLRGIFILDAKDAESVEAMVRKDSAVQTGRLHYEVYPWWTEKGTYAFK